MRVLLASALSMAMALGAVSLAVPASAATHTLSGTVTDPRDRPLVGLGIEAEVDDTIITTITDASGTYSFTFPAGKVVTLQPAGATNGVDLPDTFQLTLGAVIINDDKVVDIVMPVVPLRLKVQDPKRSPVAGAIVATMDDVSACNLTVGGLNACGHAETQGTTNAAGEVVLWLFPRPDEQPYQLLVAPLQGSGLEPISLIVLVNGSTAATLTLEASANLILE